jgi:hypothetical protein
MINLFKNLTQKTSNAQAAHVARELSSDELASVAGGLTLPPSGSSEGGGFHRLPGHIDPRVI